MSAVTIRLRNKYSGTDVVQSVRCMVFFYNNNVALHCDSRHSEDSVFCNSVALWCGNQCSVELAFATFGFLLCAKVARQLVYTGNSGLWKFLQLQRWHCT